MHVANLDSVFGSELTYFSALSENIDLWNRILGHVNSSLLNKLVLKYLVRHVPKLWFLDTKIYDACVKEKNQVYI